MITKKHTSDSPTSSPNWIDISNFEAICFNLAQELFSFDQPIPQFFTRSPGVLESCLESPLQQFDSKDLYTTLIDKTSILFYLLIKNHPFLNGNKRIAITTTLVVLSLNGYWIESEPLKIYKLAKRISASDRTNKDTDLKRINRFLNKHLVNWKPGESDF